MFLGTSKGFGFDYDSKRKKDEMICDKVNHQLGRTRIICAINPEENAKSTMT